MNMREAAMAPITLNNAQQIVDNEKSYISRRSDRGTIILSRRKKNYTVYVKRNNYYEWNKYFSDLQRAVTYVNGCIGEYLA